MKLYYNPLDRACKSLTGAIEREKELTLNIRIENGGEDFFSADSCFLVLSADGGAPVRFAMKKEGNRFTITLKFHQTGLYFYYFSVAEKQFSCGKLRAGEFRECVQSWQITVYDEQFQTPDWLKGGIMYQIFPDRFRKAGEYPIAPHKVLRQDWGGMPHFQPNEFGKVLNNDFFGGNLNGIREKLDYLQSLNVTVIYLNPIFEAYSNHRYDTGDYMKIDGLLGTEEEFDALIAEAKEKGIRIILDGVFNHTGDDSRYFNKYGRYREELGAHQSPDSPYSDWYRFYDFPDSYESWWGIDTLPAVDESSQSYQNFIFGENGVLKHWLRHGIGGYRLDVADELPDFFLRKLRKSVKEECADAVIIGEVWEDASNKIAYSTRRKYLQGHELDSVMNYPLKDAIIGYIHSGNTEPLRETVAMLIDHYPKQVLDGLMNILGTHDTPRILTVFGGKICSDKNEMAVTRLMTDEKRSAKEKVKMAALLQYTLPGVPCIYYGDENAMEGYIDPFCRQCFDWQNPDRDLNEFYRKLGDLRKNVLNDVLKDGEYNEVFADRSCLVFERKSQIGAVYVYVNNSHNEYSIAFCGKYCEMLNGETFENELKIKANSFGILTKII